MDNLDKIKELSDFLKHLDEKIKSLEADEWGNGGYAIDLQNKYDYYLYLLNKLLKESSNEQ